MRDDGRRDNDMREIRITGDFVKYAEGSCLFEAGNTRVICTASVEDGVPHFLRGKERGWLTAEYSMLPRSCQRRVPRESSTGKRNGRSLEIQRLIGRSLRSVVDLTAIGERTLWMDCDVLQADGGTRCASITGSFVALGLALNRLKEDGIVPEIPLTNFVAAVSVGIIDGKVVLDLDYSEDSTADVDMNIVMTDKREFIEIQGTAEKEPFSRQLMDNMLDAATGGIEKLFDRQRDVLKGVI